MLNRLCRIERVYDMFVEERWAAAEFSWPTV